MNHHLSALCVIACSVSMMTTIAFADVETLPLWEVAVGGGALQVPEYRGSDDTRGLIFPIVYPVYRGEYLRVDDRGIRGVLYDTDRVELDFSVDANTSVDSDEADARTGMPDLDATLQFGPALQVRLWSDVPSERVLLLNLPVRSVFAIGDSLDQVGWTASPHFTLYQGLDFFSRHWRLGLSGGLEFGTEEFHDYYYEVPAEFASDSRATFDAGGGFSGARFIGTLVSRSDKSWISLFARYDRVDGAVFEDSPLVERKDGLTFGFIYTRIIAKSKKLVESKDWRNLRPRGSTGPGRQSR